MSEPVIHSHWHQSIAGLTITPTEFYDAVAQAIARRNIPGVTITGTYFSEGGIGSAQRLYLRAKRFEYFFDEQLSGGDRCHAARANVLLRGAGTQVGTNLGTAYVRLLPVRDEAEVGKAVREFAIEGRYGSLRGFATVTGRCATGYGVPILNSCRRATGRATPYAPPPPQPTPSTSAMITHASTSRTFAR